LISAPGSFLTLVLGLSGLFTDPSVGRIASFPSRLFFGKGFVLPRIGVTHGFIGIAELVPALCGVSVAVVSRFLQDRHH